MKSDSINSILVVIAVIATVFWLVLAGKDVANTAAEKAEEYKVLHGQVVLTEFNGTTAYLIYKVDGKYYLLKKSGYGKPEQSLWKEEDVQDA